MARGRGGRSRPAEYEFTNETSVTINHGKGIYPMVWVLSGGQLCFANVVYNSRFQITVTFSEQTTGTIFLS